MSEKYLYDTDLIYYFIDGPNPRIKESLEFLKFIRKNSNAHIIFIITKIDEDIKSSKETSLLISKIKEDIQNSALFPQEYPIKFFKTSIFSLYSIFTAFSYGIRQLSPNRKILEHHLENFLIENNLISTLLLNEEGLVLGSKDNKTTPIASRLPYKQIFEITSTQFVSITRELKKIDREELGSKCPPFHKYLLSNDNFILIRPFTFFLISERG